MVRGFALFGVLLVNMFNFGAYSPIWTGASDRVAFSVMRFFFETKSWRLFSLLFGLGFSLQLLRTQARGSGFVPAYLRRLGALFLIGMGHALLFRGDVLMIYAELGLVLLLFWRAPPRVLLGLAVALLAVFPLGRAANAVVEQRMVVMERAVDLVRAQAVNDELRLNHPYAVGSFTDVVRANATAIPANPLGSPLGAESGLGFFAMFLLGLYAGKRGFFFDIDRHTRLFRRAVTWGLPVGMAAMALERAISLGLGFDAVGETDASPAVGLLRDLAFAYGSTALCLGYAAAIALVGRDSRARWLVEPLARVGRLALTVYLTQTLLFTTLFYGYGFGLAFRMGPGGVTGIAVVIFGLQIVACTWWVRRFRYGPLEWLWRGATYLKFPPMRAET